MYPLCGFCKGRLKVKWTSEQTGMPGTSTGKPSGAVSNPSFFLVWLECALSQLPVGFRVSLQRPKIPGSLSRWLTKHRDKAFANESQAMKHWSLVLGGRILRKSCRIYCSRLSAPARNPTKYYLRQRDKDNRCVLIRFKVPPLVL